MSTRFPVVPRRGRSPRGALGALLAAGLTVSLGIASSASAGQPLATTFLSAADARRAGLEIAISRHPTGSGVLVAVTAPGAAAAHAGPSAPPEEQDRRQALRLLDASPSGAVAVADAIGDRAAGLTIVDPEGNQLRVSLGGVGGAVFAPAGWLAAVDAAGRAWRVDPESGAAHLLGEGPYGGRLDVGADGALILVELSSVEAPFSSRVVRLDPESGVARPMTDENVGLVFAARALADGALALVSHRPGHGVELLRLDGGEIAVAAELDPDAVDPSISADGYAAAYAVAGDGSYLVRAGAQATRLGNGTLPRLAPDGGSIALLSDGRTVVVDPAGRRLQQLSSALTAWARCDGGCER